MGQVQPLGHIFDTPMLEDKTYSGNRKIFRIHKFTFLREMVLKQWKDKEG